ncbi:MAG: NifU family protein [Acidimicrobiales bacterium]
MTPSNIRAVGDRIEQLVGELRSGLDPVMWHRVEEVLALVTDLYGAGLAAVVRTGGPSLTRQLVDDELVASLLLLHGLHPDTVEERLQSALDDVRPYLGSHGGDVEVLEIDEGAGTVRLRLLGSCDGCPSSSVTLRDAVTRAIREATPELTTIDVEGAVEPEPEPAPPPTLVTLGPTRA